MSLTDEIYRELLDGLKKGLDWSQFLTKHSGSKGPLYNAISQFFTNVELNIRTINGERNRVQSELDQAGPRLDSMNQKIKEGESNIASLHDRENVLNKQLETLEVKLSAQSELVGHLAELEKLGFDSKRLAQLEEALKEAGMRHGLRGQQIVHKFFTDLKDYGSVLGADLRLKGLQTQIETKKLEAANWQAKEEALRRKHDELEEAIKAVRVLLDRNIKASQITTWHQILSRFQTVEGLDQSLAQYGGMTKLLNAMKEETKNYEIRLNKAQSQVETLKKERVKIEGAIDVLRVAGIKELKAMTEAATKHLSALAAVEIGEIQTVGREVRSEFSDLRAQIDALVKKVFEVGEEFERTRQDLKKYEGVKAALESHVVASEEEK